MPSGPGARKGDKLAMMVFNAAAQVATAAAGDPSRRSSLNKFGRLSQLSISKVGQLSNLLHLNQIAPLGANSEGHLKIHTKGRKMDTAGSASYFFLLPFLAWGALAVTMFGVSCYLMQDADVGLRQMHATSVCHAMATRVRFYAAQMVITLGSNAPKAVTDGYRQNLRDEAAALLALHDAIIHGSAALGLEPTLYESEARHQLLYGAGCLRTEEACRPETDPYFTPTNFGLDAMMRAFAEKALLFAAEPAAAVTAANELFDFLWDVRRPPAARRPPPPFSLLLSRASEAGCTPPADPLGDHLSPLPGHPTGGPDGPVRRPLHLRDAPHGGDGQPRADRHHPAGCDPAGALRGQAGLLHQALQAVAPADDARDEAHRGTCVLHRRGALPPPPPSPVLCVCVCVSRRQR